MEDEQGNAVRQPRRWQAMIGVAGVRSRQAQPLTLAGPPGEITGTRPDHACLRALADADTDTFLDVLRAITQESIYPIHFSYPFAVHSCE